MTQVVLGIDPSTSRLGLALVEFEQPHRALWAQTVPINEPDGGWIPDQIARALRDVDDVLLQDTGRPVEEITRIGIERAINHRNAGNSYDAGGVYHLVLAECRRRWPWADQVPRLPSVWKKDVLGSGNASKAEVMAWACRDGQGARLGIETYDESDAIGIAVSAARVELVGEAA